MKRTIIIGVMGAGDCAVEEDLAAASALGRLVACRGWILLTGGRDAGVMKTAAQAALSHGGLTLGILPDYDRLTASKHVAIPIPTGMGHARNAINVLCADIVVACAQAPGPGTWSEIMLALKSQRPTALLAKTEPPQSLWTLWPQPPCWFQDQTNLVDWLDSTVAQILGANQLFPIRLNT